MSKQSAIDAIIEASQREEAKPPAFLNAWKDGVYLAGVEYFDVACDSVGQATDKNQLQPNMASVHSMCKKFSLAKIVVTSVANLMR